MELATLIDQLGAGCRAAFVDEPVVAAYLHGSTAAGSRGPFSDVDVALLLEEPCPDPLGESLRLGRSLADHVAAGELDVRVLNGADLRFQGRVVQEGTVIFGVESPERVTFEVRTLKRYLDLEVHAGERRRAFLERVARGGR